MKGWLFSREGRLSLKAERFFYRIQWGFLSQHLTENSVAAHRYCLHGSRVSHAKNGFKVLVILGPLGRVCAAGKPKKSTPRTLILLADDAASFQKWVTCLLRARDRKLGTWYSLQEQLGQGSDGVVSLGVSTRNANHKVAIKSIHLTSSKNERYTGAKLQSILQEIQLQHKASRSEHVADIYDVFFDEECCHIAMEYGNRGSLSHLLEAQQGILEEPFVRQIIVQLGRCLLALHQAKIVHRDIKCDNVLLTERNGQSNFVLLADFGFATIWHSESNRTMFNFCRGKYGTEAYFAPEILHGERYGAPADVFSLGVLCYVCLVGMFPSMGRDKMSGQLRETRGRLESDLERLGGHPGVPSAAVSFCTALLNEDPLKRPTAAALLQHKWLRAGEIVTLRPRRRPSLYVHSRVVVRRAFHVISAVLALKKLVVERNSKAVSTEHVRLTFSSSVRRNSGNGGCTKIPARPRTTTPSA